MPRKCSSDSISQFEQCIVIYCERTVRMLSDLSRYVAQTIREKVESEPCAQDFLF